MSLASIPYALTNCASKQSREDSESFCMHAIPMHEYLMGAQGTRRYGSDEAEAIDWIVQPNKQSNSSNGSKGSRSKVGNDRAMTGPGLSEMFAYHATTMANTIRTSLIVFSRKVHPPSPPPPFHIHPPQANGIDSIHPTFQHLACMSADCDT